MDWTKFKAVADEKLNVAKTRAVIVYDLNLYHTIPTFKDPKERGFRTLKEESGVEISTR